MSDSTWGPAILYLPFGVCEELSKSGLLPEGGPVILCFDESVRHGS